MILRKKHFIATCCSLILSTLCFAEAPVVDDSDNFAIVDGQQAAVRPKYDQPEIDKAEYDNAQNDKYQMDMGSSDDGPALAKEDIREHDPRQTNFNDNAALIERVHTLQKELQELRGQLETQAHDLKLLQQQQLTFYKDLDSRLSANGGKLPKKQLNTSAPNIAKNTTTAAVIPVVAPASKTNPADEQISYLAAYELVKNKQYDNAIVAMQTFTQKYPQSGYSANAEYWLGELFMVKKNYPKAIEHFETVLQKFPSSSKSAASMLKVGYAYAASGNNQEAKKRLQQVVKTYPGTPTAQLANLKLETINAI
jgi:tol-pal system protein YbgF